MSHKSAISTLQLFRLISVCGFPPFTSVDTNLLSLIANLYLLSHMNHYRNMYSLFMIALVSNIARIYYIFSPNSFLYILAYPALLDYDFTLTDTQMPVALFEVGDMLYLLPLLYLGVYIVKNAGDVTSLKVIAVIFVLLFFIPIISDLIFIYGIETGAIDRNFEDFTTSGDLSLLTFFLLLAGIVSSYLLPRSSQGLKSGSNRYILIFVLVILSPFIWFFFLRILLRQLLSFQNYQLFSEFFLRLPQVLAYGLFIYNTSFYLDHLDLQTEDGDLTYPKASEQESTSNPVS